VILSAGTWREAALGHRRLGLKGVNHLAAPPGKAWRGIRNRTWVSAGGDRRGQFRHRLARGRPSAWARRSRSPIRRGRSDMPAIVEETEQAEAERRGTSRFLVVPKRMSPARRRSAEAWK